jgi:hypothetical protein
MPIPRLQLFELEDFGWFPRTIRDLATDYLHFMEMRFALHRPVVPLLHEILARTKTTHFIDLCSGGGGPVAAAYKALQHLGFAVRFTLTDKYPNIDAYRRLCKHHGEGLCFISDAIDATRVPKELTGIRTVFNSFHHFAPDEAKLILKSAVEARQPIGIFEIPERSIATTVPLLLTPLFVAIATPFIRPFRWRRLLWTYVLPLVPLTCWWDGIVSQLRAYTADEMLDLTRGLTEYDWTAARVPIVGTPGSLTYLIGIQKP